MNAALREKHRAHLDTLRRLVGKTIVGLARSRYVFNGVPQEDDDGELELLLHDAGRVVLSLAGDGESVRAEERALRLLDPFTLDEGGRCEWERIGLLAIEPFSRFMAMPIVGVDAIVDTWKESGHQSISGWMIYTAAGPLTYYNQGDTARIGLELPPTHGFIATTLEAIG